MNKDFVRANSETAREYPNHPLVGVSTVCWNKRLVLLMRRGTEPFRNYWSLPGGVVNLGEKLRDAALRELREETGVTAKIVCHIETFDSIRTDSEGRVSHHFVLSVFESDYVGGNAEAGDDAADLGWYSIEQLKDLKLTPGTEERIKRNYESRFECRTTLVGENSSEASQSCDQSQRDQNFVT